MSSPGVCKLILLGNGSVGKSSICERFKSDGFTHGYRQTVGLDFLEKKVEIRPGIFSVLQVWDIGGQSINSKLIGGYISGSAAIFVCYDVTDPSSFSDALDWLKVAKRHSTDAAGKSTAQIFLVGNKIDLVALRKVSPEAHDKFVLDNDCDGGFFISAQSGENVLTTFYKVAASAAGIQLTAHELAFTEKVLSVTVAREANGGAGAEVPAELAEMERADAEAAEKQRRKRQAAKDSSCPCTVQ